MCPKKRPQRLEKVLSGFVGFRFSHIAQENVELQRNEWGKWAEIHYESAVKKTVEESGSKKMSPRKPHSERNL